MAVGTAMLKGVRRRMRQVCRSCVGMVAMRVWLSAMRASMSAAALRIAKDTVTLAALR